MPLYGPTGKTLGSKGVKKKKQPIDRSKPYTINKGGISIGFGFTDKPKKNGK